MKIGELSGCNCPKALKPQQVIPGREIDPYAIKTRLGWGIIGPTNMNVSTNEVESSCLRILTQEIGKTRVEEGENLSIGHKETHINIHNIICGQWSDKAQP